MTVVKFATGLLWQAGGWSKLRSQAFSFGLTNCSIGKVRHRWSSQTVPCASRGHVSTPHLPYSTSGICAKSFHTVSQKQAVTSPDAPGIAPFADIVGHKFSLKIILEALRSRRIVQTYIFHGPSGVGKMLVAQRFAAALMGRGPGLHQCADFYCKSGFLGVNDARDLVGFLGKAPWGLRKVVVIRVDQMTEEAANALLLTLEERPGTSVVIILSEDVHGLPKTLVSRCLRVPFKPLSPSETCQVLSRLPHSPSLPLIQAAAAALADPKPHTEPRPPLTRRQEESSPSYPGGQWAEDQLLSELAEAVVGMGRGRPGLVVEAWEVLRNLPRDVLSVLEEPPSEDCVFGTATGIARSCSKDKQKWLLLAMMYWKLSLLEEGVATSTSGKGMSPAYLQQALARLKILEDAMADLDGPPGGVRVDMHMRVPPEKLWERALTELSRLSSGKMGFVQFHELVPLH